MVVRVASIPVVIVVLGFLYLVVGEDGLGPLAKLPVGEVLQLTRHTFSRSA